MRKPTSWEAFSLIQDFSSELTDQVVPGGMVLAVIRREEGREARRAGSIWKRSKAFIANRDSQVILQEVHDGRRF
jgi:hypothetical protein